jgi:hypothetical protein
MDCDTSHISHLSNHPSIIYLSAKHTPPCEPKPRYRGPQEQYIGCELPIPVPTLVILAFRLKLGGGTASNNLVAFSQWQMTRACEVALGVHIGG